MLASVSPQIRKEAIRKAKRDQKRIDAANAVKAIRSHAGISQNQLASLLNIKQPAVAKMERQNDMKLSTLAQIVRQVGGSMNISVKLPNKSKAIRIPFD